MNHDWTGKLQYYFPLKEIVVAHFQSLSGRSHDYFWENKGKIHEGGYAKEFFCKFVGWYLATWLQILRSLKILRSSNGYLSFLYKMFEKHMWNSFLLYLVAEILQLKQEISSFSEALQNSEINTRSNHRDVFCQKRFIKVSQISLEKTSAGVSF